VVSPTSSYFSPFIYSSSNEKSRYRKGVPYAKIYSAASGHSLFTCAFLAFSRIWGQALSVQTATITPIPGGTWINPGNQFVVTGTTLHFAAHAYPTNSGDPKIDHVNFTATWPGAAWRVACAVSQPSHDNVFECDWNLAQAWVPNGGSGALTVSFDVYDTSGDYNLAPNGLHQEENWTAPMRNWASNRVRIGPGGPCWARLLGG
jgi:hypothetical protein